MITKINVSMPEDIIAKLDKAARQANSSRSALLTQAARHYLAEKEEEEIQADQKKAAQEIDRIREQYGPWDGTMEILKWRDKH